DPGPKVFDDDVGGADQLPNQFATLFASEVDRDAALATVDSREIRACPPPERWSPAHRVVSDIRALDLDHVGSEIREQHGRVRSRKDSSEVDDRAAGEGK